MPNCLTCDNNCFPEPLSCYFHSGKTVGVVKNGDNQELINENLAQAIIDLSKKTSREPSCGASTCTCGNNAVTTTQASQVTIASSKLAKVSTKTSANSVQLEYDLKEAAESLGTVVSSNVKIRSNNGSSRIIKDSDQLVSLVSLRPDDFPAVLDLDVRVLTETGEKSLKQSMELKPSGGSDEFFLSSSEMIAAPQNQTDQNKVFEARIKSIEAQSQSMSSSTMLMTISKLEAEVQRLSTLNESK